MYKPEKVLGFVFVSGHDPAVVLEPYVQALDLPAVPITAEPPPVLMGRVMVRAAGRNDRLHAALNKSGADSSRNRDP